MDGEIRTGQRSSALLEGCRRGNLKQVRAALRQKSAGTKDLEAALKEAAEYGQAGAFEAVLKELGQPSDALLLHAGKWALRYHNRRILGLIMQADTGRWVLPTEYLEELRLQEQRNAKPDLVVLYLIERLFAGKGGR